MKTRVTLATMALTLTTAIGAFAQEPPTVPNVGTTAGPTATPPKSEAPAAAAPADASPMACAAPDSEQGPFLSSTGCSGVFGIRGSAVSTRGVTASDGSGLMVSGEGEEFVRRSLFSAHGRHRLAIGGGGAGFEGTLLGSLTGGFRLPVGDRHGPVVRAGAFGYLRGNNAFYASLIDFPEVELGYQYLRGRTVLELGAMSGAVLAGRFRAGDAETRVLGAGLQVGAYAAVHVPWIRFDLSAMRLPANDALATPVRTAEGTLCAIASPFAICADGRVTMADAIAYAGAPRTEVTSLYAGLAFGFTRER